MADIKPIETVYNGYRFRSRLEARWAVFFDALGVKYEYEPEGFDLGDGLYYLPDFKVKCWGTKGEISDEPFDLWIEVKGNMTDEDAEKILKFANHVKEPYRITECPIGYADNELYVSPSGDYDDHERRWECACGYAICKYYSEELPSSFTCKLAEKPTEIFIQDFRPPQNKILVVGNIPRHGYSSDSFEVNAYIHDHGICPFNYELIDSDYFAAYPAAWNGKFFLWGDDSNYIWNVPEVEAAYDKARQARFEHGESPTREIIKATTDIKKEEVLKSFFDSFDELKDEIDF